MIGKYSFQYVKNGEIVSGNDKWLNTISRNRETIYEKAIGDNKERRVNIYIKNMDHWRVTAKRYVFAKVKDSLGQSYYKFLGVYEFSRYDTKNDRAVFKRVATELII